MILSPLPYRNICLFRALTDQMLSRVDFPGLLLGVFDRTGLAADFTTSPVPTRRWRTLRPACAG
ncbi:hypothetical protein [Actinomadura xylanilytica]|uniref:hypothetical protein n=1 Tax=Actinomadura xylanilytica TaxID=887459 RepID=UPI00255B1347|nr:hypothetical protein [Actinomadura xylanilytica]MDL4776882.1 hypothetical protein [Actinomadura xylanilytica]